MTAAPYPAFDATACNPADFLGRRTPLPELPEGPLRTALETPLAGPDDLEVFGARAGWWGEFYRASLAREHWGVWHARVLEGAFWRLQDAASPAPRWLHAWGDRLWSPHDGRSVPTHVALHLDSRAAADLPRMSLSLLRPNDGPDAFLDWPRGSEWPDLARPDEQDELAVLRAAPSGRRREGPLALLEATLARRAVGAFWEPLGVHALADSLAAWDACRFGARRFEAPLLAVTGMDAITAFGATFGPAAAAALREAGFQQAWPNGAPTGPGRPRL